MCRHYANLLADCNAPIEGSKQLKLDTKYPKPIMTQFWAIFAKYMAAYNGTGILLALLLFIQVCSAPTPVLVSCKAEGDSLYSCLEIGNQDCFKVLPTLLLS